MEKTGEQPKDNPFEENTVEFYRPVMGRCARGHGVVWPFSIGDFETDYGKRKHQFCPQCFAQWAEEQWPLEPQEKERG